MRNGRLEGPTITSRFPVALLVPALGVKRPPPRLRGRCVGVFGGTGLRAGARPYFGPRLGVGSRVGDKMFDGVIPLGEALRPLDLSGPSTRACRQRQ